MLHFQARRLSQRFLHRATMPGASFGVRHKHDFFEGPSFSGPVGPPKEMLANMQHLLDQGLSTYQGHITGRTLGAEHDTKINKCPHMNPPAPTQGSEILKRSALRESNARSYVRKFPFVVDKAEGIMLKDTEGRVYYDCLGVAGTLALGHNHPVSKQAIQDYLASGAPLQFLDLSTPAKDKFVTDLFSILPGELSANGKVHFCSPAGTDCLDAAVKLCKVATGRRSVLSFHGGYHGHGQGPLAMMGNLGAKTPITGLMSDVYFLPFPYEYRQPFGLDKEAGERAVMRYIDNMLGDDESGIPLPACIVIEAIQGEGGVNEISDWSLQELRRITTKYDVPLVVDEVQAGFCRSGDFFAFNRSGIVPDVVCMSKALGGSMPMAAIAYKDSLDKWEPAAHTGTFRGNGLAFACGSASIQYMKDEKLWEKVGELGKHMRSRVTQLQAETNGVIGDVRGRGLMQGIEMVDPAGEPSHPDAPPPADGALAALVQIECVKRGLILERGGRSGAVLRMLPPLIITKDELDICLDIFSDALKGAVAFHQK